MLSYIVLSICLSLEYNGKFELCCTDTNIASSLFCGSNTHTQCISTRGVQNRKTTSANNVLDDALNRYYLKGNGLKREVVIKGRRVFGHKTEFPCVKQQKIARWRHSTQSITCMSFYGIIGYLWSHLILQHGSWTLQTVARKILDLSCIAFIISLGNSLGRMSAVRRGCSTLAL
jgi:hypothetical protein